MPRRRRSKTIEELRGIAGSLDKPIPWKEMLEIAREDHVLDKMRREEGSLPPGIRSLPAEADESDESGGDGAGATTHPRCC